jgi:hypothetical protein
MSYTLTLHPKPGYLHAVVTGRNARENVERYLAELLRESIARGHTRVLIEERLEGPRVGTMDVFEIASRGSAQARGRFERIAYVDVNAESDLMEFAENVAVNRGLPVRVFPTVADAEAWLLDSDCAACGATTPR